MTTYTNYRRPKNAEDAVTTAKYYLSNKDLLPAVLASREAGAINKDLASMLLMLANRYSTRPSFVHYPFREDMIAEALADLCKNALKFNPEKSNNPFSFYTTCVHNSFLSYLNNERKHRRIRDQLLVELGENPSWGFQDEYRASMSDEGTRSSMDELRTDISDARERLARDRERELAAKKLEAEKSNNLLSFDEEDEVPEKELPLLSEDIDVPSFNEDQGDDE